MMGILIPVGFFLVVFLLLRFVIGEFPAPFPESKDRRREIWEALGLWAILIVAVIIAFIALPESELSAPTFGVLLVVNLWLLPFWVLIPLFVVLRINKWTLRDLGFSMPRSRSVTIFALVVFVFAGMLPLLDSGFEPLPVWLVLLSLYQTAFTEEFFFRGVIQGKFERALGQNKAWFYSGILFGLLHTAPNFFGQQWYRHGESVLNAVVLLALQTLAGWVFGIIYMKTRSLWPSFWAHYFIDGRLASIAYYVSSAISQLAGG
jgi:membrane protease YdiL (CAAX protease family)